MKQPKVEKQNSVIFLIENQFSQLLKKFQNHDKVNANAQRESKMSCWKIPPSHYNTGHCIISMAYNTTEQFLPCMHNSKNFALWRPKPLANPWWLPRERCLMTFCSVYEWKTMQPELRIFHLVCNFVSHDTDSKAPPIITTYGIKVLKSTSLCQYLLVVNAFTVI